MKGAAFDKKKETDNVDWKWQALDRLQKRFQIRVGEAEKLQDIRGWS